MYIVGVILGVIIGLLLGLVFTGVLLYFRTSIEKTTAIVETKIASVAPRAKGNIIIPLDEGDEAREEIIKKNQSEGRSTKVSDLQ